MPEKMHAHFTSDKHKLDYKNSKILTQKLQRRQRKPQKEHCSKNILRQRIALHICALHSIVLTFYIPASYSVAMKSKNIADDSPLEPKPTLTLKG